jgi:hypothetical protein
MEPGQNKSGVNPYIVIGSIALTGGIYYFGVRPWLQKKQAQNLLTRDQGSTIQPAKGKVLYNIAGKPIGSGVNLATIAADIYGGLHPGWYQPTSQERVIRAFFNTPFGYVQKLEQIYLDKYGEQLRDTMADKLSDVNFIRVKNWLK